MNLLRWLRMIWYLKSFDYHSWTYYSCHKIIGFYWYVKSFLRHLSFRWAIRKVWCTTPYLLPKTYSIHYRFWFYLVLRDMGTLVYMNLCQLGNFHNSLLRIQCWWEVNHTFPFLQCYQCSFRSMRMLLNGPKSLRVCRFHGAACFLSSNHWRQLTWL
jgi:hypothetical protein